MFGSNQLKSELGNENFEEDIKYINNLTNTTLQEYGHERLENEFLDTLSEINNCTHTHLIHVAVESITEESIKAWNSVPTVVTTTSQVINDANYLTETQIDKELERFDKIIISSEDGGIFLITVNDNGTLNSKQIG